MSTTELREAYRTIPRSRRREMLQALQELEAEEAQSTPKPADVRPLVSLEEAKAYLYKNCDGLLHRLAQ